MPPDGLNLDAARAHLLAVAQDMRAIGLDYYAEHLEYVLREHLTANRAPDPTGVFGHGHCQDHQI